jgi:glycine/D-amino acid oxidase-like deaminating enzyme
MSVGTMGIIGAGHIGQAFARLARRAGRDVADTDALALRGSKKRGRRTGGSGQARRRTPPLRGNTWMTCPSVQIRRRMTA